MIVSVTSKDGVRLYTKVKAKPAQAQPTREQLQRVADARTAADMLTDGYYLNPGCAALDLPCDECRSLVKGAA